MLNGQIVRNIMSTVSFAVIQMYGQIVQNIMSRLYGQNAQNIMSMSFVL